MLVYLWCMLWLTDWRIRHTPASRLLASEPVAVSAGQDPLPVIHRIVALVQTAARRHPANATCLRCAWLVRRLLARQGISTQLVLGARRRDDRQIGFHAWLEYNGEPITDSADVAERFSVLSGHEIERAIPLLR